MSYLKPEAAIAYVQSQTAAALIELEVMKSANRQAEARRALPEYYDTDFIDLIEKYDLDKESVKHTLTTGAVR